MITSKKQALDLLAVLIAKKDLNVLYCLDLEELLKPLIFKDWVLTGGKLGYKPLALKYGFSVSKIRTICAKFERC